MSDAGAFLFGPMPAEKFVAPETLPADARLFAETMRRFVSERVTPSIERLEAREDGLLAALLRDAGAAGLLGIGTSAQFGGIGLSRAALTAVYAEAGRQASFAIPHNVHCGVATLPILWFGDDPIRARFLPRMARGEALGAFALSEPQSGSDALSARCQAERAPGGWRLTGAKAWITNAGVADVFTVFATAPAMGNEPGGFTAFVVPRQTAGVTLGPEESKLGLRGSSTRALYLDGAFVPDECVLGGVGAGHRAALYPLNVGRLAIAAVSVGMMREALRLTVHHVRTRRQFGGSLSSLGLVRESVARMGSRLFAAESVVFAVAGMIDASGNDKASGEEFAVECAIAKVFATEALGFVVDSGLQLFGGLGYGDRLPIARLYRDARVFRIFEGASEINRLTIAETLKKRVSSGRITLTTNGTAPSDDAFFGLRGALRDTLRLVSTRQSIPQEASAAIADLAIAVVAGDATKRRCDARQTPHWSATGDELGDARRLLRRLADSLDAPELERNWNQKLPDLYPSVAQRRTQAQCVLDAG